MVLKNSQLLIAVVLALILISGCQRGIASPVPSGLPPTSRPTPTDTEVSLKITPTSAPPIATQTSIQSQGDLTTIAESWMREFETSSPSAAQDALQTSVGDFLLVGATNYSHRNSDNEDIHLMKVAPDGELLWEKTYGGEKFDRGVAVIATSDDAYMILAETRSYGAGERDIYLLKIDPQGEVFWSKTFGGSGEEQTKAVKNSSDDGFIIIGTSESFGDGSPDIYLVKVDANGEEQWSHTYGGALIEEGYDVHETTDGGFLVLAASMQAGVDYMDQESNVYLIKTDAAGDVLWSQVYEQQGVQGAHRLLPLPGGDFIITGLLSSTANESDVDPFFRRVDSQGNIIWDGSIGDPDCFDYASDVFITTDGYYLLTGMAMCSGRYQIALIKTTSDGSLVWRKYLIEGSTPRIGVRINETEDGGIFIVGQKNNGQGAAFETVLIKTDREGNLLPGKVAAQEDNQYTLSAADVDQIEKLQTFSGHNEVIVGLTYHQDGKHLASLASDFTLKIWELSTGKELDSVNIGKHQVYNVAFTKDGAILAVGNPDNSIGVWELESGQKMSNLVGHKAFVMKIAFSPDGARLASADCEGIIKLWDVISDQLISTIKAPPSPVGALAFSPDGKILASGNVEGSNLIKLWDVENGQELRTIDGHTGNVYNLVFTPDGSNLLSASGDQTIGIWQVQTGETVHILTGHKGYIYGLSISPDGTLLASGDSEGIVNLWDMSDGEMVRSLKGHRVHVFHLVFSPDGNVLASGGGDGEVLLWGIHK